MDNKQIKQFNTAKEAYDSTTEEGRIAVVRKTYLHEKLIEKEYFSYVSEFKNPEDLREDFPYCVWSNQTLTEIGQDDE